MHSFNDVLSCIMTTIQQNFKENMTPLLKMSSFLLEPPMTFRTRL